MTWHVISNNVVFWRVDTDQPPFKLRYSKWLIYRIFKQQAKAMRRLIQDFAGRTYHTVGNPMPQIYYAKPSMKLMLINVKMSII